ncbi:unnamed protein product [Linum tenue]|uniref:Uncharacterized protein n=1 Tax=Linum tenue TaxID=586396 RepID=A0AAV0MH89_9ROSI|nr:unnamed protein product [Linum tenue]
MGLTNFILTIAGVSAVVLLLRSDVKQSAVILRRNVKHIRTWLEEESAAASKSGYRSLLSIRRFGTLSRSKADKATPKELETKVPPKETPKEEKV